MRHALFLTVLLCATLARALPELAPDFAERILRHDDPVQARVFLEKPALFEQLKKADPEKARYLRARALELRDVEDVLLRAARYPVDGGFELRTALSVRPRCRFCQSHARSLVWLLAHHQLDDAARRRLARGYLEWTTLPHGLVSAMKDHDAASWTALEFNKRWERVTKESRLAYEGLLAEKPADVEQARNFTRRAESLYGFLSAGEQSNLRMLADKHSLLAQRLAALDPQALASDPKAAEAARSAGTVEERLAALKTLFDNAGKRDSRVDVGAAAAGVEDAPPELKKRFADLLVEELKSQVRASMLGEYFSRLQSCNLLAVDVEPLPEANHGALAQFDPKTERITINRRVVEDYLKERRLSYADLVGDPGRLATLGRLLFASFTHEVIHGEQHDHRRRAGATRMWSFSEDELEAYRFQAVATLHRLSYDETYRDTLEEAAAGTGLAAATAAGDLSLARRADTEGLAGFTDLLRHPGYAHTQTAGSHAWCGIAWHLRFVGMARAELQRRERLDPAERDKLETGEPFKDNYADEAQIAAAIKRVGSAALRQALSMPEAAFDHAFALDDFVGARTSAYLGWLEQNLEAIRSRQASTAGGGP